MLVPIKTRSIFNKNINSTGNLHAALQQSKMWFQNSNKLVKKAKIKSSKLTVNVQLVPEADLSRGIFHLARVKAAVLVDHVLHDQHPLVPGEAVGRSGWLGNVPVLEPVVIRHVSRRLKSYKGTFLKIFFKQWNNKVLFESILCLIYLIFQFSKWL